MSEEDVVAEVPVVVAGNPSVSKAGVSVMENGVNVELEPVLGAPVLTGGVKVSWAKATELQKINATQAWDRFNIRNKVLEGSTSNTQG